MAAQKGRAFAIKKNGTVIAGMQAKTASVNNNPVDVTTDDELGFRTLMSDPGVKSMDISFDGITKDTTLRALIMANASQLFTDITLEYPNGDTVSGDFFLANLEEAGDTGDALKFSGSLQSSGVWTYTAA
jgi:predicted secreted protein